MKREKPVANRRALIASRAASTPPAEDAGHDAQAAPPKAGDAQIVPVTGDVSAAALAAAVADIKNLHHMSTLQFALGVGKIVIDRIFGGRVDEALRRGPKDASLKVLAEHPGLPIGARQLYVAVGAYEMFHRIGLLEVVATWPLLGYSHVRALLPAPPEEHERLVAETLENDWTVDQLQKEVEKLHPRRRGGRRPASPVVKAAAAAVAGAASLEAALRGKKPLDDTEARQVFDAVKRILGIMRKMHERLRG